MTPHEIAEKISRITSTICAIAPPSREELEEVGLNVAGPSRLFRRLRHKRNGGEINAQQSLRKNRVSVGDASSPPYYDVLDYPISLSRRWDSAVCGQRSTGVSGCQTSDKIALAAPSPSASASQAIAPSLCFASRVQHLAVIDRLELEFEPASPS